MPTCRRRPSPRISVEVYVMVCCTVGRSIAGANHSFKGILGLRSWRLERQLDFRAVVERYWSLRFEDAVFIDGVDCDCHPSSPKRERLGALLEIGKLHGDSR